MIIMHMTKIQYTGKLQVCFLKNFTGEDTGWLLCIFCSSLSQVCSSIHMWLLVSGSAIDLFGRTAGAVSLWPLVVRTSCK